MGNIQSRHGDDVAMKCSSIHDNLPHGKVFYSYRVIMHYNMTRFVNIPSPLPKNNIPIPSYKNQPYSTIKLTAHVR